MFFAKTPERSYYVTIFRNLTPHKGYKWYGSIFNHIILNDPTQFLGVFAYLFFITEILE